MKAYVREIDLGDGKGKQRFEADSYEELIDIMMAAQEASIREGKLKPSHAKTIDRILESPRWRRDKYVDLTANLSYEITPEAKQKWGMIVEKILKLLMASTNGWMEAAIIAELTHSYFTEKYNCHVFLPFWYDKHKLHEDDQEVWIMRRMNLERSDLKGERLEALVKQALIQPKLNAKVPSK